MSRAEIDGLKSLDRYLKALPARLAAGPARDAVRAAAAVLHESVRDHAPVDSGAYRGNVKVIGPATRGPSALALVAVDAADFPHPGEPAAVEFGTDTRDADAPMRRAVDSDGPRAAGAGVKAFALGLKREIGS